MTDEMRCAECRRPYDANARGRHASRFWFRPPVGLLCRTCSDRAVREPLRCETGDAR